MPPHSPQPLHRRTLLLGIAGMAAFAAFAMLKMWGVEIALGWLFARNVLSVLLVMVGGLLAWAGRVGEARALVEPLLTSDDPRVAVQAATIGVEQASAAEAGGQQPIHLLLVLAEHHPRFKLTQGRGQPIR